MIPISRPFISDEEANAAKETILSGWITQGSKVKEFEDIFAKYVGAPFACAVSNCTTALHIALLTVGVSPGDVVITVSHSFIATTNVIRYCFAEPVFVDIEKDTFNMSATELEKLLERSTIERDGKLYYKNKDIFKNSPLNLRCRLGDDIGNVSAIIAVHQMGRPCDIKKILEIGKRYNIKVIEDAACAVGSEVLTEKGWEKIGKPHGDVACFSFHPRKIITTGEGGMLTTSNPEYDKSFRLLRQHGMTVPDLIRHSSNEVIFEQYEVLGYNYRMTDIQASIGIIQLSKLDSIIKERKRLAKIYKENLMNVDFISLPREEDNKILNWQSFPIILSHVDQKRFMQALLDKGISTRRGIMNAHQERPYNSIKWNLPVSEFARDNTVLIPFFNGITDKEISMVIESIKRYSPHESIYK